MSKETAVDVAKDAGTGIEGKLVEMLDALQNGAVKVGEQVVKYSPDVADAALWVVRIDGAQKLVLGIVALIALYPCVRWTLRLFGWAKKAVKTSYDGIAYAVPILGAIGTVMVAGAAATPLLNVWNWIAVIEPKLWLAKQIIAAVLK